MWWRKKFTIEDIELAVETAEKNYIEIINDLEDKNKMLTIENETLRDYIKDYKIGKEELSEVEELINV